MLEKTQGVVLRLLRYQDEMVIADIYTASRGALGFLVRMPRSRKNTLRTMLLRPLNIVELEFDYRPAQNLQRLRSVQMGVAYRFLPYEPMKETVALFLSEFLYHALKNEDRNMPLFQYLKSGLLWFDEARSGTANFHLVFLMRLTRFLGFWPDIPDWHKPERPWRGRFRMQGFFDLRDGVMMSEPPMHDAYLSLEESAAAPFILRMDFHTIHLYRLSREQRNRILDVLTVYYRLHVAEFPELKSPAVLREVIGG